MAIHLIPKKNKPLTSYINSPKLKAWAEESFLLLKEFPQLKVWEVQYKGQGYANTCWYVGFASKSEPFLFNFGIVPSNLDIEFRYSKYLPENIRDKLKWRTKSLNYADLKTYGKKEIKRLILLYIKRIKGDFDQGVLKQGGKSFAETVTRRCIEYLFPGEEILSNHRPDNLRSEKTNKPLELDIYVPKRKLAIEVQGPQHFKDGMKHLGSNKRLRENDIFKKDWCKSQKIKLIWWHWHHINENLIKIKFEERVTIIKKYVFPFLKSRHNFLFIGEDGSISHSLPKDF